MSKNKKDEISINVFTAFSGYDSQCMALEKLHETYPNFNYKLVGWSEIDEPAIASHNAVFPEAASLNYGDISKVDWSKVPDFDLFTYSSPCLPADQKIYTKDGYKPISEIQVGDIVYTKGRTWEKVVKKFDNGVHPTCIIKTLCGEPIRCTLNHKFWVRKLDEEPKFVEAKDLSMGYHFCVPVELNKEYYKNEEYRNKKFCALEQDGYLWFPLISIEQTGESEHVYNIEVENDHSYIVSGCVSANCQDWSRAGLQRGGAAGSGTRSSLLWECERTIREKRPKYCLLENVKALYSDSKFKPYLFKWRDMVDAYGYKSWIKVLNAADYDVPQGRERVFMVSIRLDVWEKEFNKQDYLFPAPMKRERKIEDFLVDQDMVPEEYYIKEHKIPKFLNLLNHAGEDFENALDEEQIAAINTIEHNNETDNPIGTMSAESGLNGYVPAKDKDNALF